MLAPQKKQEAKEEYLRLLYVAMTRAEDELYVAGSGDSNDEESWYNLIKKSFSNQCRQSKFFNEKNKILATEKFEIADEILEFGEEIKTFKAPAKTVEKHLKLDGVCNPVHTFIKNKKELNIETLQTSSFAKKSEIAQENAQPPINHSQIKGKLIHKILEVFGKNSDLEKSWLKNLAEKIIAREEFLSEAEKNKIRLEIFDFLDSEHFEKLFSGEVKCEVEIAGSEKIKRIDLLIEKENEVLIVDYKSEETMPKAIPQHYIEQLKNYGELIKNLYPNKKISLAIFWIKFLELEFVAS